MQIRTKEAFVRLINGTVTENPYSETPASLGFNGYFQGFLVGNNGQAMSTGFVLGGEGGSGTLESIRGLILFEEFEHLSEEQLDEVINGELFAFTITDSDYIVNEVDDFLIWGWSSASAESSLLLTRGIYGVNGTNTLLDGTDAMDSQGDGYFEFAIEYDSANAFEGAYQSNVAGFDLTWGFWFDETENLQKVFDESSLINEWNNVDLTQLNLLVSAPPTYQGSLLSGSANLIRSLNL